jgi:choline dehydrogenase-like flavoprotein
VLESGPLLLLTHVQSTDLRFDPNLVRSVQQGLQYSPQAADGAAFGSLIGCVGGRGLFWNGAAPRFAPSDFAGWPFDYKDLESEYLWAEQQFRVTCDFGNGPLGEMICRLLREAGIPAQPGPYAVDNHATAEGWLAGTVGNSLSPLLRTTLMSASSQLISLGTRSFARRIIVEKTAARGVETVDRETGAVHEVFGNTVVLAAGGFESVRLAMVSGISDPHGLMGRFISDHMFCRAYYPVPPEVYDPIKPEVAIVWVPAGQGRAYQIEIHLPGDNVFLTQESTLWEPDRSAYYAAMVRSFAPVEPRRDNYIEVVPGDAPGSFRVHLTLDADDLALRDAQTQAMEAVRVSLSADTAQVQLMPQGSSHHEAGGLIMGSDASSSVTDGFGRFRTVDKLLSADASTWPDVSPTNPHLTIVAIARRMARELCLNM